MTKFMDKDEAYKLVEAVLGELAQRSCDTAAKGFFTEHAPNCHPCKASVALCALQSLKPQEWQLWPQKSGYYTIRYKDTAAPKGTASMTAWWSGRYWLYHPRDKQVPFDVLAWDSTPPAAKG